MIQNSHQSFTPYSDHIIFFDTEFSYLDPRKGELLSIGMIKPSGEELYLEFSIPVDVDPWVEEHVLPHLQGTKVSKQEAQKQIQSFCTPGYLSAGEKPYLVAYVNQFDAIFWYDLFASTKEHPAYWIPIDFASILFGLGFDPNSMGKGSFFEFLGINKAQYRLHNALDDARLLRDVYTALQTLQK